MDISKYQTNYQEALERLNPEQKEAVTSIEGPLAVLAGPGTGKTQILTLRIAHIIHTYGDDAADNILALTFTNSAVRSMRERLASFVGFELAKRVGIFTFHSFAQQVIQNYPEAFQERAQFSVATDIERIEMLEKIIDEHHEYGHLKPLFDNHLYIKDILFAISKIKQEGYSPEEYQSQVEEKYKVDLQDESLYYKRDSAYGKKGEIKKAELQKLEKQKEKNLEIVSLYSHYKDTLEKRGKMDYADLLLFVLGEFRKEGELLQEVQETYQYILVDEHQDTNDGQNELLKLLVSSPVWEGNPNIFTVGDQKQSIFRFAGANESSFSYLMDHVPETKTITLGTNYRSSQDVLDSAHALISASDSHADEPALSSFFDINGEIEMREFSSYVHELSFIASSIKEKLDTGKDPNEMAVLYRKNTYAADLRNILDVYGIPYKDYSKKNLLEHVEMKKLFLLFTSLADLQNNEALARLLYIDFIGIHPFTVSKVLQKYRSNRKEERKSIYAIISDAKTLKSLDIDKQQVDDLIHLAEILQESHTKCINDQFISAFSFVIRESGFLAHLASSASSAQDLKVLETLFNEIKRESFDREEYTVVDFISYIRVLKKHKITIEIPAEHVHGVSLLTFHGSKGLEFEDVYIYRAIETRKMPERIKLALDIPRETSEDERRLLFVALTRAKANLYISYPLVDYQGKEYSALSFLYELPGLQKVETTEFEQNSSDAIHALFAEKKNKGIHLLSQEYIEKRFLGRPLSVSALNNFVQHPVLYFFRNLVLLPEAMNDSLEFGNCIHMVLELVFADAQKSQNIPGQSDFDEILNKVLETHPQWEKFRSKATTVLADYVQEHEESFVIPAEVEYPVFGVEFDVDGQNVIQLGGRIDRIDKRGDGEVVVVDYKTGKAFSDKKGKNKEDTEIKKQAIVRQAVFYALLLDTYRDGLYKTRKVVFDFVEPNSKDIYERHTVEVSEEDIEHLKSEIREMSQFILTSGFSSQQFDLQEIDEQYQELFMLLKK